MEADARLSLQVLKPDKLSLGISEYVSSQLDQRFVGERASVSA
jgi:hypothetical protein